MAVSSGRKPVIGLIGGIGSGKSLVARQMASLGCAVIDADALAKQAYADPEVVRQLVEWWGPAVVEAGGQVDRKEVARRVFSDRDELTRLEGLIHPRVHAQRRRLRQQYQGDPHVVAIVEDTPLLLEKGLDDQCDVLVFVDAARDVRLARLAASRGWSPRDLAQREKNQVGLDTKARRADYVVENNGDEDQCLAHVRHVLSRILKI